MSIGIKGDCRRRARLWHLVSAFACTVGLGLVLAGCGGGDSIVVVRTGLAAPGAPSPAVRAPAAAALVTASGDVLASDDFEAGMAGWSNWGNAQVVDGAGTARSRAMQVGTGAGGAGLTVGGLVPGGAYRLTAQVRVDPSELVYLGINILDASGQRVAQQAVPVTSTGFSLANVEIAAPSGASSAVIFVWKNAGSGYAYVDDVLLARATAAPPPSGNLLSNPGFEAGTAGWVDWGNTLVVDGAGVSGSRALRVGTAAGGAGQDVAGIVAGAQYTLTAQVRVSDPSESAFIGVNMFDASGAQVAQQAVPFSGTSFSPATVRLAAPATAVRAVVFVWKNAGSGFALLDDFVFVRSDAPAAANLVVNPGFENLLAGWDAYANATVVNDAGSGAYAARMGPGLAWVGQYISFTPGQSYTFSAQGKISSDSPVPMLVTIQFLDSFGDTILRDQTFTFSRTSYETASATVVAPPDAVYAWVMAWRGDFSLSGPPGFGDADNISVVATPAP